MAYQVLARKWRPKKFADLVGQEHVVQALRNALDKGRLHHAYLLTGTRGVGKTTIARILAKSLNCEHTVQGEPCGQCAVCSQIDSGRFVDLLEIDAASNTGIDNIREVLENAQYAPTAGRYKVYIIDEVHMLSKSAFNAMLKTLEEPPGHVKFILATTDPHKVPVTVLSRCLQFVLRNMTAQQVADHLAYVLEQENVPFEAGALQLLGRAAAGSMRDALSLLDQAIAMGSGRVAEEDVRRMIGAVDKRYLYELLQSMVRQDGGALIAKAQEMAARAVGFDHALADLAALLQRLALLKAVPDAVAADDPEYAVLQQLAEYLGDEQIQLYYQCVVHGRQDLALAPDEYAGFVMTLLRMLAFTPLAAGGCPPDGTVEGTQLGAETGGAPKKPPVLPQQPTAAAAETDRPTAAVQTASDGQNADGMLPNSEAAIETAAQTVGHEESAAGETDDVPPWETVQQAEADVAGGAQAAVVQTVESMRHTVYQADDASDTPSLEDEQGAADAVWAQQEPPSATSRPSENGHLGSGIGETAVTAYPSAETVQQERPPTVSDRVTAAPAAESDMTLGYKEAAWPRDDAADGGAADGVSEAAADSMVQQMAAETADGAEEEAAAEAGNFVPLPDFAAENWPLMVKRLAPKLGAAQMLAQHSAWADYDAGQNLLYLSLNGHAELLARKEYFDKIRAVLADAYLLPDLKLQTLDWQDHQGWETPKMYRARLQQEGRARAQSSLENEAVCQQVMAALDCREWKADSLELLEHTD
ncbi:DNA polymerase III subunit gamma/tau [Neisseria leonii]|uniref:DNA polymerase III subunit gamma/tau n=1 Tax=Neisseria leonii TaxID=2995413 RepID=A0A9X4ICY1_9NEIS|nr:DNA polymerase III subunit gamma/tau [Neisseria sp. 51.81]MDD9327116.1 DNA polymerase III subunit gamma/tau [Neisseria sp. 51.81]